MYNDWSWLNILTLYGYSFLCRHESGTFYPATDDGSYTMIGEGQGTGYNINVPWENGQCGDADYLAVWDTVLIPVAKDFNPDMILVSAGFDAGIELFLFAMACRVYVLGSLTLILKCDNQTSIFIFYFYFCQ